MFIIENYCIFSVNMDNHNIKIKYHKWNQKMKKSFFNSCKNILHIKDIQFYQPYFSLYFHIHNTKLSHKTIDINRNLFIHEIKNIVNEKYYTSNIIADCLIYDKYKNHIYNEEVFCKCIPLLDPIYLMQNNYNNVIKRNHILPSSFNYNTYHKINSMDNSAYIDSFFSFICSEITTKKLSPSFPLYYGSITCMKDDFSYDISDDHDTLQNEKWFKKNLGKNYTLDIYVSSSDEEDSDEDNHESSSDEDNHDEDNNKSSSDSDDDTISIASSNEYYKNDDYIVALKNIPCELFFIEKLDGTLEDLLDDNIDFNLIISCIFQVSFGILYLQKHYQFTHNDLHVNNIMFKKTDKDFFYYKYNNIYFKVPTYGYVFKIIDFGRSIFTFHNKLFFNDSFKKYGEAEGQFKHPFFDIYNRSKNNKLNINFNFDICRLAITILDVCNYDKNDPTFDNEFYNFIYNLTLDNDCNSLMDLDDDFNMYISITNKACNSLPSNIIQNKIFNNYRIKKKYFPKKLYYHL